MAQSKILSQVIGEHIRTLREGSGRRQDDLALTARQRYGLPWTRATVAAIETGKRRLSIEEMVLLPMIMSFSHCSEHFIELKDLIPEGDDDWVKVSPESNVHLEFVRAVLQNRAAETVPGLIDSPESRRIRKYLPKLIASARAQDAEHQRIQKKWGVKITGLLEKEKTTDAVLKVARRLRTVPLEVVAIAHKLWDRGLEEERDRRIAMAELGETEPRGLQALRGHVTRKMIVEMRSCLEAERRS